MQQSWLGGLGGARHGDSPICRCPKQRAAGDEERGWCGQQDWLSQARKAWPEEGWLRVRRQSLHQDKRGPVASSVLLQTCAPTQPPSPGSQSTVYRQEPGGEERRQGREGTGDSLEHPRGRPATAGAPEVDPRPRRVPSTAAEPGVRSPAGGKASPHPRPGEARALTV